MSDTELNGALLGALTSALSAATGSALRWDDRIFDEKEIPDVFLPDRTMVLIFLLPRVFKALGMPMASFYSSLWQYGQGEYGSLKEKAPGEMYWRSKVSDFTGSVTVTKSVSSFMAELIDDMPSMESSTVFSDRWKKLRELARQLRQDRKGEDKWEETTKDYRGVIDYPDIHIGNKPLDTLDYMQFGEKIAESDAYGSIGPFALRGYLYTELAKKAGDERIYVSPKRIAVRIYDSYGFTDTSLDKAQGLALSGRASQFLGKWANARKGEKISLSNEDFGRYREDFKPIYNSFLESNSSNKPRLVCRDFESFSEYVERDVTGRQYVLAGA